MRCYVHPSTSAGKGIGKTTWISELTEDGQRSRCLNFISNHHQSYAIFQKFVMVELLEPADTRFVSYYILLQWLWEVKGGLWTTIISDTWAPWRQSSSDIAIEVRHKILADHFLDDVKFIVDFIEPLCDMVCYKDINRWCLGEQCIHEHKNKFITPLLVASYALNPIWDIEETIPLSKNIGNGEILDYSE